MIQNEYVLRVSIHIASLNLMHIVIQSISKMIVGNNIKECREPIMCLCQLLLVKMSYYKESTASERTSLGIDASQKQNLGGLCIE